MKNHSKTSLILTISSAFEYYDFIIYGLMSSYLGPLFFPSDDLFISQIKAFSVFALGYIARPLGAIIFGMWSDLKSRKNTFIKSNLILAISTIAISFLPNYDQINFLAPLSLVVLRILQSFAFSAELPGAMTILKESHPSPTQGFSFVVSGAAIGSLLASSAIYSLEKIFTEQQILNFAWRLPFLLSALLCVLSYIMRTKLPEVPQKKFQNKNELVVEVTKNLKKILSCVMIFILPSYLIITNLFFPSLLKKFYNISLENTYLIMTISLVWAVIFAPFFAYISKNFERFSLIKFIVVIAIFLLLIIHNLLQTQNLYYALLGFILYQSIITAMMTVSFPIISNIFSPKTNFTSIALSYNFAYTITSLIPVFVTTFTNRIQSAFPIWLIAILICFITLTNIIKLESNDQ